jgi:hypothetical protein
MNRPFIRLRRQFINLAHVALVDDITIDEPGVRIVLNRDAEGADVLVYTGDDAAILLKFFQLITAFDLTPQPKGAGK